MDLNKIISQSFTITSKYRHLWLLSFLTIIGGVAYEQKANLSFNIPTDLPSNLPTNSIKDYLQSIYDNIASYLPLILAIIVGLFIVWIILYIIGLISKAGILDSVIKIDQNQSTGFSDSFSTGRNFIWRFFLLRLLYGLAGIGLGIISVIIFLLTIFLFFITIPAIWLAFTILNLLYKNAEILIIKHNIGVIEAVKTSWQLFVNQWKNIGILWLINLAFSIALGIAQILFMFITIFFSIFIGVFAVLFIISLKNSIAVIAGIIIGSIIILLMICFGLFLSSIIYTFFTTYWTLGINSIIPAASFSKITPQNNK